MTWALCKSCFGILPRYAAATRRILTIARRNAGVYHMMRTNFEDAAGWMAYLLPLAHTPDYRARVLLAMSSCFLHQGKIAGDYA